MIRYRHLPKWHLLRTYRGTVMKRIMSPLFVGLILCTLAVIMHSMFGLNVSSEGHSLLIMPVAFLLVFRTDIAYARYWEGRTHYEVLVHCSTEIMRLAQVYVDTSLTEEEAASNKKAQEESEHKKKKKSKKHAEMIISQGQLMNNEIFRWIIIFMACVRRDARQHDDSNNEEDSDWLGSVKNILTRKELNDFDAYPDSRPAIASRRLSHAILGCKNKLLMKDALPLMEAQVEQMTSAWRGVQTIVNTPLPFPYKHMMEWFLALWCFSAPFALVSSHVLGLYVLVPMLIFALYGMDAVAGEIENPFGFDENDLDLQSYENAIINDADMLIPTKLNLNAGKGNVNSTQLYLGSEFRMNTHVL